MLGVLITLIFALGMEGLGRSLYGRWMVNLDPAARTGIGGILGLGTMGLLTLFIGLIPNGFFPHAGVVAPFWILGIAHLYRNKFWLEKTLPRKPIGLEWLFVLAIVVACLFALVAVLAPSTAMDWDTIAYHLAVPKLWLKANHIFPIDFIHHSNFPDSVDLLYVWGLTWGGQSAAKAFQLAFYIFGIFAIFGLTRQRYGGRAASWAALTFATVPAVLWEAGSAYIDVAHGLYVGLGVVVAVMAIEQALTSDLGTSSLSRFVPQRPLLSGEVKDLVGTASDQSTVESHESKAGELASESSADPKLSREERSVRNEPGEARTPPSENTGPQSKIDNRQSTILWPLAGLLLGFAAGSKYTGLQVFIAVGVVFGGYLIIKAKGRGLGQLAAALALATAIGCPWYIKNILWTGNPVYPFFYKQFGGTNWSQFNADIYSEEQNTFGVPRTGPAAGMGTLPESVMGLAFMPGRYTNPRPVLTVTNGQADGAQGFWFGAIGAAVFVAGFAWCFSGKLRRFEGLILGFVGFSFLMWFVLSQQSRYAISFVPILAMLLGAGVVRLRAGPILAAAAALQALATLAMFYSSQFQSQIQVALGKVPADQYLSRTLAPYRPFQWLNEHAKGGRVALYDEVFGFYLDVPYFWANPGHSTVIGYDKLNDGAQFVARMKELGFTYIYLGYTDHTDDIEKALGIGGRAAPISDTTKSAFLADPRTKYKFLICDAATKGLLKVAVPYRQGVILQIL
ncbi:MAG TPA: hypothetical protein VGL56_19765 [Fimbriimonadaceae bacterium]|jgi:hypothetical protein